MFEGMKNLLILTLSLCALNAQAQVKLNFDLANRGQMVTDDHYGIFFEEINHPEALLIVAESAGSRCVESSLSGVPERSVAEIVAQSDRAGKISVEPK